MWGQLWEKWISIANGSSKLTHSLFIAPFKYNIHSPWVGIRQFWSGSYLFCMRKPCVLAFLWALDTQRRPNAHSRCPRHADLSIRFVHMVFWFFCRDAVKFIWIVWVKQYPIWSARILFSYSIVPFSKGPYSGKICIKLGNFWYGLLDIFRTRIFFEGNVFYMRRLGYFSDPVLIIEDPWSLYGVAGFYITLRDVSYNARWFWTTIRYGPMTTAYLC